jgi:hypothetical protein
MKKRLFAMLMALVMTVGVLPFSAMAAHTAPKKCQHLDTRVEIPVMYGVIGGASVVFVLGYILLCRFQKKK